MSITTPPKTAYFLGIAGVGTSALAALLQSQGVRVLGSDEGVYPPVSDYLRGLGIDYFTHFDAAHIPPETDLAIIGTSAKLHGTDNAEYQEIIRRGLPHYTFAAYLGALTQARENVVVAGSFGKSTVTALLAFLLQQTGLDAGYFIGAKPLDFTRTGHAGTHALFVLEGDEYFISTTDKRPKLALYQPHHSIITSLVHDHVNIFPTFESYQQPFRDLVQKTPAYGVLLCAHGVPALHAVTAGRRVVWYGLNAAADYYAANIQIGEITRFTLHTPHGETIALQTPLLGLHNIENCVAAAAFVLEQKLLSATQLQKILPQFRGLVRRLDKKTTTSRVPVYEGFGSSYEKARSAIEAMQLHFPARPLVVVFEPHTFSWRNQQALAWYDTVFQGVARVLLLPPPTHGAGSHQQLSHEQIIARISATGVKAVPVADGTAVLDRLAHTLRGDEVVLLLSSGGLDGLPDALPAMMDKKFQ